MMRDTLNTSLYAEFGQDRVDEARAQMAYDGLLKTLGKPEVIVATTNYDRSAEAALRRLGKTVLTGFRSGGERAPRSRAMSGSATFSDVTALTTVARATHIVARTRLRCLLLIWEGLNSGSFDGSPATPDRVPIAVAVALAVDHVLCQGFQRHGRRQTVPVAPMTNVRGIDR